MRKTEVQEHYFKKRTEIPLQLGIVKCLIGGKEFEFYTSPPVFSWRRVDNGTLCLAKGMQIAGAKSLLDMGCGYGIIGIVAAHFNPELEVAMIDSSERAVFLARKNVKKYELQDRVEVLQGNLYAPVGNEKFDVIVSNPPYSAGKGVVNEIIEKAPAHLNPGGSLQIVGRHTKGGRMYKEEMLKVFKSVEETGRKSGFRVYIARQAASRPGDIRH